MCGELNKPLFTVFTPTFNRAHTLPRVYESLESQTYRNFEWIIVDDGSTDETHELVKAWQKEADFSIRYFWQPNRGKHVAFNRGVKEAYGQFFLPLDSDDACVVNALERFKYYWNSIPADKIDRFSGVCGLCQDQEGRLIGDRFPFDLTDSDSLEIFYRYKVKGDKWGFQRTNVLRHHLFPELDEVKFIPEGVVWNAIAKSHRIRFINEILLIVFRTEKTGSVDRLTQLLEHSPFTHAVGCALYYETCLNEHIVWFRYAPLEFIRSAIHYIRFSLHSGKGTIQMFRNIRPVISKILILLAIPIGAFLYTFEKRDISIISVYKSLFKGA